MRAAWRWWWLGMLVVFPSVAHATCVSLNQSAWSQDEKNGTLSVAYELTFAAGKTEVPTVMGALVCATTFDPTTIVTQSAMETRWDSDESARQAATAALLAEEAAAKTEQATNILCGGNIADLDAKIDALTNSIVDLPTAKLAFNTVLKKIARCERANWKLRR